MHINNCTHWNTFKYRTNMASIKTGKVTLPVEFQIELVPGWLLDIDVKSSPTRYTLTHGKKSLTFHSNITKDLCSRNYGIRLTKGRRHMVVPPYVLQAFVDNEIFLQWYDQDLNQST